MSPGKKTKKKEKKKRLVKVKLATMMAKMIKSSKPWKREVFRHRKENAIHVKRSKKSLEWL